MDKNLFQQFKDFVNAQPADKAINNDGWNSCAIGEFAKSIDFVTEGYLTPFARKVCIDQDKLFYSLDHSWYATYGDLQQELKILK